MRDKHLSSRYTAENALRESEERYRSLSEDMPVYIISCLPDGIIIYANAALAESVGMLPEDMVGSSFFDLFDPVEAESLQDRLKSLSPDSPTETHEQTETASDGSIRYHLWTNRAFFDDNANATRYQAIGQDVTELRNVQCDYRLLFHGMLDGFTLNEIICDELGNPIDYRFLTANPAFERITGLKAEDVIGRTVLEILPGTERHWIETYGRVALTGEPAFFENYAVEMKRYFEVTAYSPLPGQFAAIFRDISERKQAEQTLKESEQRVQKKLQSILSPFNDIGPFELADILDIAPIQHLMDEFYQLTHVPNAIVDLNGKVLVNTGWQDICTKFHRLHPETLRNCIECDTVLSKGVPPGTFTTYLCKNNLWDCVTPLMVGGQHVGNLFTGQFFFEGEKPDDSVFIAQAAKYGFDEKEYMAAVSRVPVWDRETINVAFEFYITLANIFTSLSYGNITLARMLEERNQVEQEKRRFYRDTIKSVTQGKLELVSSDEVQEYLDPARLISNVRCLAENAIGRHKIMEFCASNGLQGEGLKMFELAVGEAVANSIKHANGCKVYAGISGESIWVAIADIGKGISTMLLPGATLRKGYSSKVSMGMGYTIMMEASDKIMLNTGSEGTTVVLSVKLKSYMPALSLDDFQDLWDDVTSTG